MTEYEQTMDQIELSIGQAEAVVEKRDWLKKLESNREFKKLILTELFEKEPVRLVDALSDPAMAPHQAAIQKRMLMISELKAWLRGVIAEGQMAENAVREAREELDAILAEEAEEQA